MPINSEPQDFSPCSAVGVRKGDKLIAGFVYNCFTGRSIDVTAASVDPAWSRRRDILHALFAYPFLQLGCTRMSCHVSVHNKKAIKLAEGLGFVLEGRLRRGYDGINDALLYGMLREECNWLRG
jgi:ribosomal protein S18 acetylase RimI-like enzyme